MGSSFYKSYYERFSNYMEKDTKGVEIGIYTLSGIAFVYAYFKIRPITKFVKPYSIPRHFIKDKLKQNGTVTRVEPSLFSGPLLCINHKPPINLFLLSKKTLPVKIAGVEINTNGYSWLQSVVVNKRIKFVPLNVTQESAECKVLLVSAFQNKKDLDIADALISLGFAKATPIPMEFLMDKELENYYKTLNSTELKARRQRVGIWLTSIPPPIWPFRFFKKIVNQQMIKLTPPGKRLPQLVR